MVKGAMQIEAIRRREEVHTLRFCHCSLGRGQGVLSIAVPISSCAVLWPTPGQSRPAQGRGASAPTPKTSPAAASAAGASGARSSLASSRAAADSPAVSQSMIPLTVAQRAKAAAAALGAHGA